MVALRANGIRKGDSGKGILLAQFPFQKMFVFDYFFAWVVVVEGT